MEPINNFSEHTLKIDNLYDRNVYTLSNGIAAKDVIISEIDNGMLIFETNFGKFVFNGGIKVKKRILKLDYEFFKENFVFGGKIYIWDSKTAQKKIEELMDYFAEEQITEHKKSKIMEFLKKSKSHTFDENYFIDFWGKNKPVFTSIDIPDAYIPNPIFITSIDAFNEICKRLFKIN